MDVNWLNANYLPWLILFFPLLSAAIIMLFTNRSVIASQAVSVGGIGLSWVLSLLLFVKTVWSTDKTLGEDIFGSQLDWLDIGSHTFRIGVMVDPLTAYMLLMVPLACLMIFLYSVGYMRGDPKNARFFGYLALFAGAMLTLTVADNLLLLFIGWEVMGFCSYSLIGFWAHKKSAMEAGVKAFMTTRVADVLMLVGIGYLFVLTMTIDGVPNPTLNFRDLMYNALPAETAAVEPESEAAAPAAAGEVDEAAASSGEVEGGEHAAETEHAAGPTIVDKLTEIDAPLFGVNAAVLIGVLLVIGTVGKSAQFPLHTWLPDAMEGPTPVSAMIHAAAMVSAGVYMLVRVFPLLSAGANFHEFDYNTTMYLMGLIGAITALGASVLAVGQNDIKRILAYSTVSQLGYMVAALGIGAWVAAAFHLINHAFFKSLLFMASGSVIHAMEHGEHHSDEHHPHEEPDGLVMDYCAPPNDIQRMGGLLHRIPVTAITMALGGLSLAGFPLVTAGFWSKDEIISEAWHGAASDPFPLLVLLMLLLGAALTAFYTARMWFMTFWGTPRTDAAAHSGLGSLRKQWVVFWNRRKLSDDYKLTQEPITARDRLSANQMELPLVILAFLAVTAGFIGIHKSLVGRNPLHDFLAGTLLEHPEVIGFNVLPMLVSMILAVGGLALGWYVYGRRPVTEDETDPVQAALGPQIWTLLQNRLYIDILYRRYLLGPVEWFVSEERWALPGEEEKPEDERVTVSGINYIDRGIIDDILHSIGAGFVWLGEAFKRFNTVVIDGFIDGVVYSLGDFAKWFRQAQTGRVQQYLLFVTLALLAIGTLLIIQVR